MWLDRRGKEDWKARRKVSERIKDMITHSKASVLPHLCIYIKLCRCMDKTKLNI